MLKPFQEGDAVIIFEDLTTQKLVFLEKGVKFQNRFGIFTHDQIIGLTPGSKVFKIPLSIQNQFFLDFLNEQKGEFHYRSFSHPNSDHRDPCP